MMPGLMLYLLCTPFYTQLFRVVQAPTKFSILRFVFEACIFRCMRTCIIVNVVTKTNMAARLLTVLLY